MDSAKIFEDVQSLSKELPIGKNLVFTNGCFDILHIGHLDLLDKAKALGDILVVGVNDDDSVRRLNGNSRPVNQLNERMELLAALDCVDFVIKFEEDTPLSLILELKPQVLVKGGDYKIDEIVGAKEVLSDGGSVEIIDFVHQISTTEILDKLRNSK